MPDGDGPDEAAVTRDMLGLLVTLPKASRRRVVDTLARACGDVARRSSRTEENLLPLYVLETPGSPKDSPSYGESVGLGANASNGQLPPASPILKALERCARLGNVPSLRTLAYWRAEMEANPDVSKAVEILKAEAWIQANRRRAPRKDLPRFLHNWLAKAQEDAEANG